MRRAARTDGNHLEIVGALTEAGAVVTSLAAVGKGVPDLLVSYRGTWTLMEIKDGRKPPSERRLTLHEKRWQDRQLAPVHTVNNVMEALEAIASSRRAASWREAIREGS
jgi:hypothetical protein